MVQVNDALQVEANLEILRYSNFRSLDFNVGNNAVLFGGATQIPELNNTFTAGFAVDYALTITESEWDTSSLKAWFQVARFQQSFLTPIKPP